MQYNFLLTIQSLSTNYPPRDTRAADKHCLKSRQFAYSLELVRTHADRISDWLNRRIYIS